MLRWIAAQPWCTGAVGMFGISWGGFNGLQVAAHAPPELKTVISLCSTDDRYADDVHYRGGAVLALEMLSWAASMLSFNAIAPDPEVAGPGWREAWLERIDRVEPYEHEWLRHQRRDDYWKQGSVCEDFSRIKCPVYAIGGWADGYSEAVLRLLAGLEAPCKGLLGPWSHAFPDEVEPGPAIGFLQECLRWWDRWLKGEDTGIDGRARASGLDAGAGDARGAPDRAPGPLGRRGGAGPRRTSRRAGSGSRGRARSRRSPTGSGAGSRSAPTSCAASTAASGAPTAPTARAPSTSAPRTAARSASPPSRCRSALELLGNARVELELESDRPVAQLAARLCDVAPDGSSLLVTRGVLNLTHRNGHEHPEPLEPGRRERIVLELDGIAQAIPAGHRAAPGALARVLAVAVAGAGAGHARDPHRRQLARPPGAPAARRGRAAAAVRRARAGARPRGGEARAGRGLADGDARLRDRAHRAADSTGPRAAAIASWSTASRPATGP